MLCADVSHKIMRADTVYDYLNELYQSERSANQFHDTAIKNLVGEVVLTRYSYTKLWFSGLCFWRRGGGGLDNEL